MKRTTQLTIFLLVLLSTFLNPIYGQSWGDYTLIASQGSTTTKLVTLTGTVYKTWTLTGANGYSSFLTPDRCIIRIVGGSGAGAGSKIEKVNWDGQVVWSFSVGAHHDICYMPNGHVLAAVLTTATSSELSQYGFTGVTSSLKYDKIVEIDGVNGQIVWEWRFIDHTVQNNNSSLANYGDPSSTPNKFNVAVQGSQGYSDWQHLNGIDYNPARDQIVFSCKHLKEIYVIDHSTTTAEAKTGSGGLSGKGGDFLYRWGNPTNYGKTGSTFGVIHDAAWCLGETYQAQREDPSASNYHPFAQMISVWSNTNVSGMCIIPPYIDSSYNFSYTSGSSYLPTTYYKKVTLTGNSTNMGGNQMLPNGNMLLFAGAGASTVYEKDSTGGAIWSNNSANGCSKVTRYSAAYVNGDYATICANTPIGIIDTTHSNNNQGIADIIKPNITFKNPVSVGEILKINQLEENSSSLIQLFDMNGRLLYSTINTAEFIVPDCETGLYILKINNFGYKLLIQNN
ncbi:MAG: hypothetical protein H6Q25_752 [Bacteroidetes bacterium]|nr:hypothetical protein [Bacteroidota bacterium]